jgi:hypothetical protein
MSSSLPESVAPVVREWLDRLVWLEASLRDDPHQFEAWRRHIQVKVLKFLVRRYFDQHDVTGPRLDELFRPISVPSFHARPGYHPVKTAADYLPMLRRIAEANQS